MEFAVAASGSVRLPLDALSELKAKIQETFLTLDSNPEGKKYLENVDSEKFVAMKDSDYDIIREAGVK